MNKVVFVLLIIVFSMDCSSSTYQESWKRNTKQISLIDGVFLRTLSYSGCFDLTRYYTVDFRYNECLSDSCDTIVRYNYKKWYEIAIYCNNSLTVWITYFNNNKYIESFFENGKENKRIVYRKNNKSQVEKIHYYVDGEYLKTVFYKLNGEIRKTKVLRGPSQR